MYYLKLFPSANLSTKKISIPLPSLNVCFWNLIFHPQKNTVKICVKDSQFYCKVWLKISHVTDATAIEKNTHLFSKVKKYVRVVYVNWFVTSAFMINQLIVKQYISFSQTYSYKIKIKQKLRSLFERRLWCVFPEVSSQYNARVLIRLTTPSSVYEWTDKLYPQYLQNICLLFICASFCFNTFFEVWNIFTKICVCNYADERFHV